MFSLKAGKVWPGSAVSRGVLGKLFDDFRPWEFFFECVPIRAIKET